MKDNSQESDPGNLAPKKAVVVAETKPPKSVGMAKMSAQEPKREKQQVPYVPPPTANLKLQGCDKIHLQEEDDSSLVKNLVPKGKMLPQIEPPPGSLTEFGKSSIESLAKKKYPTERTKPVTAGSDDIRCTKTLNVQSIANEKVKATSKKSNSKKSSKKSKSKSNSKSNASKVAPSEKPITKSAEQSKEKKNKSLEKGKPKSKATKKSPNAK